MFYKVERLIEYTITLYLGLLVLEDNRCFDLEQKRNIQYIESGKNSDENQAKALFWPRLKITANILQNYES